MDGKLNVGACWRCPRRRITQRRQTALKESVMGKRKLFELELEVLDMKAELKIKSLRGLGSALGVGLLVAALVQELRKPAADRVWHGRLWGRVPYEFRPPTLDRLRAAYWAPEDTHIFTNTAFGVGWSVNLGHLMQACSSRCAKPVSSNIHDTRTAKKTSAAAA
jgi:hypothetical protein